MAVLADRPTDKAGYRSSLPELKKCHKLHIGKESQVCPKLLVHEQEMDKSVKEKYLGDFISNTGKNKENIQSRINRGYGIVADILAILEEVPLGKHKIEIGLLLRQSLFLNGILFNSEAWSDITEKDVSDIEKIDELVKLL